MLSRIWTNEIALWAWLPSETKQKSKQKYIFRSMLLVKVVEKTALGYKIS